MVRALAAGLLAALAAASAAVAGGDAIVVRPGEPVVNTRSTIEVRAPDSAKRLSVRLVTPTGVPLRVGLYPEGAGVWRKRYRFMDDGTWTLLVRIRGRARLAQGVREAAAGAGAAVQAGAEDVALRRRRRRHLHRAAALTAVPFSSGRPSRRCARTTTSTADAHTSASAR